MTQGRRSVALLSALIVAGAGLVLLFCWGQGDQRRERPQGASPLAQDRVRPQAAELPSPGDSDAVVEEVANTDASDVLVEEGAEAPASHEGERFEFAPLLVNTNTGGTFRARGSADLPDGTVLYATLLARGASRHPTPAVFLGVTVHDGKFEAEWTWQGKVLAPMTYEAELSLLVSKQPPQVRKHLVRSRGWDAKHCEHLAAVEIEFGTVVEQSEAKQATLDDLAHSLSSLDELLAAGVDLCSSPAGAGVSQERFQVLAGRLQACYLAFHNRQSSRVVKLEDDLNKRLLNLYSGLTDGLRSYQNENPDAKEQLLRLSDSSASLRAEIVSRRSPN